MNKRSNRSKKQVSLSQSLLRKKTTKNETINANVFGTSTGNSSNFPHSDGSQSSNDTQMPSRALSTSLPEANDFDDSFDLFLPRKAQPPKTSLQPSLFEVKKKSRYFDETGELRVPKVVKDDDLELAIAVSLEESKGNSICLKPTKTTTTSQPRGRLKHAFAQSLLMRRTPGDRERIVTEKVAIVLMNNHKLPVAHTQELPDYRHSLYSALLRKQVDELRTLWTLSQKDLSKIKSDQFNTSIIVGYTVPSPWEEIVLSSESGASGDEKDNVQANDGGLKLTVSSEDIFGCSDGEEVFSQGPSPKRPRNSASTENLNKTPNNGDSSGNKSWDDKLFLRVEPTDLIGEDREDPVDLELALPTVQDDCGLSRGDDQVCQMEWEHHQEDEKSAAPAGIRLKHLYRLSSDLRSLSSSAISKVVRIDKGCKILHAHSVVFKARCPLLGEELEKNENCLDEYTWAVCDALFDFVYAADSSKVQELSDKEKKQMVECCRRFNVEGLIEEIGGDELVDVFPDVTPPCSSPRGREDQSSPVCVMTEELISNQSGAATLSRSPGDAAEVVVLDSDCCTVDEASDEPAEARTDDELDLYLKDGIRMLEQAPVCAAGHLENGNSEKSNPSPSKSEVKTPKKSIDKYFEDSFPSFTDIKTATPHSNTTPVRAVDEAGTSKAVIKNCVTPGGKLIVSEVATPLPDYESMVSPELQDALQKYGIRRGIGRRKAVTLLKYIYDQIHPPVDHPAVVKALSDVAKSDVRPKDPASSESEVDIHSLSSDASDWEAFEDLGDVTSADMAAPEARAGLLQEICRFFKRNTELYVSILRYEPIWLNQIHRTLKEEGIKCNKKELIATLDELGITFRTEKTEKQMQRRRARNVNTRRRR